MTALITNPRAILGAILLIISYAAAADDAKPGALPHAIDTIPGQLPKIEMIQIPEGSITLNDPANPGKTKTVKVKSVWMSKTELLWDVFDIYAFRLDQTDEQKAKNFDAESRPSKPYGAPDRGFGHQGYPALSMHVHSAEMFCKWLSAKTGKKYRLPTEAEWEYACRAGSEATKPNADGLEPIAWFWDNADDKTHPAGQKKPNAWGFLDTLGNAAEWAIGIDGKPTICGGSFQDKADKVFGGARDYYKPDWQAEDAHTPKSIWWLSNGPHIGMRIVREE